MILRALQTRRNAFSLIGRLPPEILSRIFSFRAINQPPPTDDIYYRDYYDGSVSSRVKFSWITVTHVCRRWRQVALSDPNLWNTVVFDLGMEWAEEMIARSKATLISYSRDLIYKPMVTTRTSPDDEASLRKHLSRIRRLVLSGYQESLVPAVRALITPAPHLESLELLLDLHNELCLTLPSDLFAHNTPKLLHVTLSGCAVPWDWPLFRGLTHLDIYIPPVVPPTRTARSDPLSIPTVERLLSILEAMPSLQVLALRNCLPRPEFTSRVVPLRYMSKLSLHGSLSEVIAVLEQVSLPSSASLFLRCSHHNRLDGPLDTLVSLLASHFLSAETPTSPLSAIAIAEDFIADDSYIAIIAPDMDVPLESQLRFKPSAPARLHLVFTSQNVEHLEYLPLQVFKASRDLHTLSITYPAFTNRWLAAECMDVCSHCLKVTHLRLRGGWPSTLTSTLKEPNAFPSLVTLTLEDISDSRHEESLGVLLPVILRARKNAGFPVRRVNFKSCSSASSWIESLREAVNDVTCEIEERDSFGSRPSTRVNPS